MKYTAETVPLSEVEKFLLDRGYDVKNLDADLMQVAKEETAMTLNGEPFLGGPFEFPPMNFVELGQKENESLPGITPGTVDMKSTEIPDDIEIPFDSPLLSRENSLYLTMRQKPFDEIIAGTKTIEYRDVSENTFKNYIRIDEFGNPYVLEGSQEPEIPDLDIFIYNDGICPFWLRDDICFLRIKAGATAKDMDSAVVEVKSMTLSPSNRFRYDVANNVPIQNPDGKYCVWVAELHLGKVRSLYRKQ